MRLQWFIFKFHSDNLIEMIAKISYQKMVVTQNAIRKERKLPENNKSKFSKKCVQRLSNSITNLFDICKIVLNKKKVTFISLTLSSVQIHSDYTCKKMLNYFFTELQKKLKSKIYYVWKAERQRNGNIHFHVLTNVYVSYELVKLLWNNIQKRYLYIKKFFEKHLHINPNSVDVKRVYIFSEVKKYLKKYFQKEATIEGRAWGCSDKLKFVYKVHDIERIVKAIKFAKFRLDFDYFTIYFFSKSVFMDLFMDYINFLKNVVFWGFG